MSRMMPSADPDEAVTSPAVRPLDCPDTCSLSVTHADGRISEIRASNANPFTGGRTCKKVVRYYPECTHGETGIRHPMTRVGAKGCGEFETVSWHDALDLTHAGRERAVQKSRF